MFPPTHRIFKTFRIVSTLLLMVGGSEASAAGVSVGITLHPYFSFVANIVGDRAEIVPLIDADANPHGYSPQPGDMIRITSMDVLVVNGIGHDSWFYPGAVCFNHIMQDLVDQTHGVYLASFDRLLRETDQVTRLVHFLGK